MARRISERDLILPTLHLMKKAEHRTISTSRLITELRALMKPTGEDLEILAGRQDDRFSQIVRNLRSHRTLESAGFATYKREGGDGYWTLTTIGEAYLSEHIAEIIQLEQEGYKEEFTSDDLEDVLAEQTGVESEESDYSEIIEPFDPKKIQIETRSSTISLLMSRIRHNEIDLLPDFQRAVGVWTDDRQSRMIESLLLRIPLPAFYFDASDDNNWIIIDGLQRLTALRRFILEQGYDQLKLRKLEFLTDYNSKSFHDLPRNLQRRIEETEVTLYLVQRGTPAKVKFNIFKRINTGGMVLSNQEIRHALNLGQSTILLKQLAQSEEFVRATDNSISSLRMTDRECVLRYLAFQLTDYHNYTEDLDSFLIRSMQQINKMGAEQIQNLTTEFKTAMTAAHYIFGRLAFRKIDPNDDNPLEAKRNPVSKALFEVWSVSLSKLTHKQINTLIEKREFLLKKFQVLMDDTDFVIAISYSTGNKNRVIDRFYKVERIIQETLNDQ